VSRVISAAFLNYVANQDATATITLSPSESVAGWTAQFTVRGQADSTALITKTTSSGITVSDATNGVFQVSLSATDLTLTPGLYRFELTRTNPGAVYPIAEGSLLVTSSVYAGSQPTLTNVADLIAVTGDGTPDDTDALRMMFLLGAVEAAVKRACGRNFTYSATQTQYLDADWSRVLRLRETPVESVTSLYYDLGAYGGQATGAFAAETLLAAGTDYYLDRDRPTDTYSNSGFVYRIGTVWAGWQERPYAYLGYRPVPAKGAVLVSYRGGFGNNLRVPMDLALGIIDGVQMLRQTTDLGRMKQSESGEGYTYSLGPLEAEVMRLGSIRQVISTYRRGEMFVR
jgi:hypothetical protein